MIKRILSFDSIERRTAFLWGPRQAGKTTLLRSTFPRAPRYDLLLSDEYRRLLARPALLREECEAMGLSRRTQREPIIIDEIQKIPDLLDEVHWLIENRGLRFILCGSSARKLRKQGGNLLGGRAVRLELHPLVYPEIKAFSLEKALNAGLLPKHYLDPDPAPLLRAYVGDYLREEIAAEAITRNLTAFNAFLEIAALSNGEIVNFTNIARECGVAAPTVKNYFQILEDTLVGRFVPGFARRRKRRLIAAPKFFYFDVGVVAHLARRGVVTPGSELFGRALEHFIFMELRAHSSYSGLHYPLAYWQTASGIEVDFVLGEDVAVEVKATARATDDHMRGLRAFREEHKNKRYVLVTLDKRARRTGDGIDVLPCQEFLEKLWGGGLVGR
jgi:predicted AAA+ superfamily ATPase